MELLFRQDAYLKDCTATVTAVDNEGIRLDRTVFYPMGGGQPGDKGQLILADGRCIEITDTLKDQAPDSVRHIAESQPELQPGMQVTARIDWPRRHRLMRMHTCLHLLCSLIKGDVTGGQVSDGKGRLDFNLPETVLDKEQLTRDLNALIAGDHPVQPRWISDEELAEKPELVRTMSVKPPSGQGKVRLLDIVGVDLQPCGGTHVARTGEIGRVEISKIENKGKMNRRVNIALLDA
ncbi:alanyl-tRNA editing protein [Dongia soli]|uniref:Alanine--tRNA ligase n=1 Tax=Dongia soli TaxID=600628 RepID=A0ABU5EFZ2_9PROT|nr:alanyl-tRNA editing protein [Dongia soli]MDY0885030.1 alanyl-tRNA editing protein [Dongia soli]